MTSGATSVASDRSPATSRVIAASSAVLLRGCATINGIALVASHYQLEEVRNQDHDRDRREEDHDAEASDHDLP